jgi:hypothetical protein
VGICPTFFKIFAWVYVLKLFRGDYYYKINTSSLLCVRVCVCIIIDFCMRRNTKKTSIKLGRCACALASLM